MLHFFTLELITSRTKNPGGKSVLCGLALSNFLKVVLVLPLKISELWVSLSLKELESPKMRELQ